MESPHGCAPCRGARLNRHLDLLGCRSFESFSPCGRRCHAKHDGSVALLLPGVPVRLKSAKPKPLKETGHTLAARLRRRRAALGLTQPQAAARLGVIETTVWNWENSVTAPPEVCFPAIIAFLGYEPWPNAATLAERLRAERLRRGLSQKAAALSVGVDPAGWRGWERGARLNASTRVKVDEFLGDQ